MNNTQVLVILRFKAERQELNFCAGSTGLWTYAEVTAGGLQCLKRVQ